MGSRFRIARALVAIVAMATETCSNCGATKRVGKPCRNCGAS